MSRTGSPLWLVCYDVANDKRRRELVKHLERHCQRVQFSVFECPLSEADITEHLEKRWLPQLNLTEDSLREYPLNKTAREQAKIYGGPPPYQPPDYVVL
jgi:CRISPR-associated protein Cas2